MSRRGSAQLLLLFFGSRRGCGWTTGTIASVAVATGLLLAGALPTPAELAQALRESAWDRARAGLPEQSSWPWAETQSAFTAKVPRLGLSASVVKQDRRHGAANDKPRPSAGEVAQNAKMLSEVAVGDRITVTTASGASRVYRVTGRKVVDPHLAESDSGALSGDATLVTCRPDPASSLELDIQATTIDPPTPKPGEEHKL